MFLKLSFTTEYSSLLILHKYKPGKSGNPKYPEAAFGITE